MGSNISSLPKDYEVLNKKRLRRHVAITVIIPVYDAIIYLERTINSVLVQTIGIRNVTIIAVDDKSTDGSRRLLRRLSALYPQLGPGSGSYALQRQYRYQGYSRLQGGDEAVSTPMVDVS